MVDLMTIRRDRCANSCSTRWSSLSSRAQPSSSCTSQINLTPSAWPSVIIGGSRSPSWAGEAREGSCASSFLHLVKVPSNLAALTVLDDDSILSTFRGDTCTAPLMVVPVSKNATRLTCSVVVCFPWFLYLCCPQGSVDNEPAGSPRSHLEVATSDVGGRDAGRHGCRLARSEPPRFLPRPAHRER